MKVIVADDEKWVRAAIIKLIPFEALGLTLACEASNGIEAIELCREHRPNILITDICMPGLSGLELIEEIKQLLPEIKIIIISGFSDFEYAKKALQLNVADYLLKPVDQTALVNILIKLRDTILDSQRKSAEATLVRQQYKAILPIASEKFLNQLIQPNSFISEYVKMQLSSFDICFSLPCFTVVVFAPASGDKESVSYLRRIADKALNRRVYAVTFSCTQNYARLVAIINHGSTNQGLLYKPLTLCSKLYDKHFKHAVTIGISAPVQRLHMLPEAFIEAQEAIHAKFWKGQDGIYTYGSTVFYRDSSLQLREDLIAKLLLEIKISDFQQVVKNLEYIFGYLSARSNIHPEQIKEFLWALVQSILTLLSIQLSFVEYEILTNGVHPYDRIKHMDTFVKLASYIRELFTRICKMYHRQRPANQSTPVETAKSLITQNYNLDISLEQISNYVYLSPTYFSELFKKETGMSFIDYKTLVRIENAKKLLQSTELSLHEISSRVGYTDPKYFSKLFKKIVGVTQQEFRQKTAEMQQEP